MDLLVLDLDGTILDPEGALPPRVESAIAEVRERGVWILLATGRRFRTALPAARKLELRGPIVVNNGAIVKEIETGETLHHDYLPAELYPQAIEVLREAASPMVYVDAYPGPIDIVTGPRERAHPFQTEYLDDNLPHCRFVDDLDTPPGEPVIMVSTMGDARQLAALGEKVHAAFGPRVRTHSLINKNYRGQILELLSPGSGKWSMVRRVAEARGVAPERISAVGDDRNDVEMIRNAGVGIAMGNAVPEAKAAADFVTGSNAECGVAEAIEYLSLRG